MSYTDKNISRNINQTYLDANTRVRLEQRVAELERKLATIKEDTIRDMENRLGVYDDTIRSDKGEVILKKNFIIKNRKTKMLQSEGGDIDEDNVVTMYFNDRKTNKLNQIFIGTASAEGFENTSLIQTLCIEKNDGPDIVNNGAIQIAVASEDDDLVELRPQFQVFPASDGQSVSLRSKGDNSVVQITHQGQVGFSIIGSGIGFQGNIFPGAHNTYDIGTTTNKIKTLHAVSTNIGDLNFQNGWSITEAEKVGIKDEGLAILDKDEKVVAFIGKKGLEEKKAFVKTTKEDRANMETEFPDIKKAKVSGGKDKEFKKEIKEDIKKIKEKMFDSPKLIR